ncbi:phage portal protein [Sulfitobacter sp. 1A15106]|uniref:phage portal protein n=1 Tax=Sulfitobacter sp. 1A15106 TaxID=3368590 RepID=UPI0037467FDB
MRGAPTSAGRASNATSPQHMNKSDTEHEALTSKPSASAGYHAGDSPDPTAELDLSCWAPPMQSANMDILPSKDLLESRTVDLASNDGNIAGSLQYHVDHAIGTGLKLSCHPNYRALGQTEEWGEEYANLIEDEWRSWIDDDRNLVDVTGVNNWSGLQAVAYRSLMIHGEILATFEPGPANSDGGMTHIRIIDPARLSNPKDGIRRNRDIRGGIEHDANGRPVAYWISSRHPRDLPKGSLRMDKMTWQRVPKYGRNGRRKVFHAFDPIRAEQSRGVSIYATVLRAAKMLDKISDATLQAALLQTVFAAVVKSGADWGQIMEVLGADSKTNDGIKMMQKFMKTRGEYYSRNKIDVKGAKAIHLLPDETLSLESAKSANPDTAAFIDQMSREVARGQNMTLEQYSGDYSKVNFSSARMSNIQSNKAHVGRRKRAMAPFCQWVFGLWLEEFFLRNPQFIARGTTFRSHRQHYARAEWIGPPMVDADPEKTAKAAEKRMAMGITTMEYEASQIGLDWEEMLVQRARELRKKQELGLFELESLNAAAGQPPVPDRPEGGSDGGSSE